MYPLIAREGYAIIAIIGLIAAALFVLSLFTAGPLSIVLRSSGSVCALFLLFSLYFFRDPERTVPLDAHVLISPADGTIIDISKTDEPEFMKGPAVRVGIFMSVFNVHVNRSPVNGTVDFLKYNPGKFFSAFKEKASEDNENLLLGITCSERTEKISVKFIAGLIARRIVFYKKLNAPIIQGERINMIRFGSRVDLYCPLNTDIKVALGDKVTAGVTILASFKD